MSSQQYASKQPAGFNNHVVNIAIVGVCNFSFEKAMNGASVVAVELLACHIQFRMISGFIHLFIHSIIH